MICVLTKKGNSENWCERHQRYHNGHHEKWATGTDKESEAKRAAWDNAVGIKTPVWVDPPVMIKHVIYPANKYAVITCAVNHDGRLMQAVTGDNLRAYADRIGADFHVITGDNNQFGLIQKLQAGSYLDHYERIIFLDIDIVVSPNCPNLFDIVPEDSIGMHDDYAAIAASTVEKWLENEYKHLQESQDEEVVEIPWCLNSGVIVCSQRHKGMFNPPKRPFLESHCAEQSLVNINIFKQKLKWANLKRAYNWQWWINRDRPNADTDSVMVWHAAGFGMVNGKAAPYTHRIDWLKRRLREIAENRPMLSLGDPDIHPGWEPPLDLPGSQWMTYAESQMVRKYAKGNRYLELGTYGGYSAAIAGAVAKSVTCLDRFDPSHFGFRTDDVERMIKWHCRCPVTLISGEAKESVKLLKDKYDVILVDGDHHYESVRDDIETVLPLLMKNGVILFHDSGNLFPGVEKAITEAVVKYGWAIIERAHSMVAYALSAEVVPFLNVSPELPGFFKRSANYLASLTEHVANGSVTVSAEEKAHRRGKCDKCQFRNKEQDACSLCGCSLESTVLGDKLAWAVSRCFNWERVGVAIGCYNLPKLVELQIQLIADKCGGVPVLLCDDSAPGSEKQIAHHRLAKKYPHVKYWPNPENYGHHRGDSTVFWKAIQWGKVEKLDVVCKLSHRHLVNIDRWLQDGAAGLLASGHATGTNNCIDNNTRLYVRSECCLLNVAKWFDSGAYKDLQGRNSYAPVVELHYNHIMCQHFGAMPWSDEKGDCTIGNRWVWPMLGERRNVRKEGLIWHCTHGAEEYRDLALKYGITLDEDFHVDGCDKRKGFAANYKVG